MATKTSAGANEPIEVLFALHDGFNLTDFAGPLEVLASALHDKNDESMDSPPSTRTTISYYVMDTALITHLQIPKPSSARSLDPNPRSYPSKESSSAPKLITRKPTSALATSMCWLLSEATQMVS